MIRKTNSVLVATWFYSGLLSDKAAGTIGSLASLPLCGLLLWFVRGGGWGDWFYVLITALILVLGIKHIPSAELDLGPLRDYKGRLKSHDQNQIVIDEVFGMLISCAPIMLCQPGLLVASLSVLLAFGLFRLFDITKPPPAKFFDRLQSAWGVMLDDGIAGVYAALGVWLFI